MSAEGIRRKQTLMFTSHPRRKSAPHANDLEKQVFYLAICPKTCICIVCSLIGIAYLYETNITNERAKNEIGRGLCCVGIISEEALGKQQEEGGSVSKEDRARRDLWVWGMLN